MVTILLQKILDLLKAKLGLINTTPETASGAEVVFDTDKELPLDVLKATITATQESGTPTPDDNKAITGYDSVVITQKDGTDTTVNEITVALGQTVYGGILDAINGTLTINKKIVDLGDYTYTYNATYERMQTTIADLKATGTVRATPFMCTCFQSIDDGRAMADVPYNSVYAGAAGTTLVYIKTQTTDPETFNTAVKGQKLVYPIEPVTITGLTPANITTINGTNKLSANCGDLEVEYRVSTQSVISYKDLTSDLTINTECIDSETADVRAYQQGNLVYVQIQNLKYSVTPEDTTVIVTGLPKPKLATNAAVADGYDLANSIRFRVNTDGELQQWYTRPYPNHYAVGQFVYITDEV